MDNQDILIRAVASLRALRDNVANLSRVGDKYVIEFHAVLDKLESIDIDVSEFRIPSSEVGPVLVSSNYLTGSKQYSHEQYVDKAFILAKLDAIIGYLDVVSSSNSKRFAARQGIASRDDDGEVSYDVFLSYSVMDEEDANRLHLFLSEHGVRVYFAKKSLNAGDDFSEGIRKALRQSAELWVLITPGSLQSEWVTTEWGAGWALGKRIVPILLRCEVKQLPQRLRSLHCADYHEFESLLAQLSARLGREGLAS
jgi:hypothetical protein